MRECHAHLALRTTVHLWVTTASRTCAAVARAAQNKQVVVASGGRELVMAVLKRHSLSAAVALAGCGVVVNTSAEGTLWHGRGALVHYRSSHAVGNCECTGSCVLRCSRFRPAEVDQLALGKLGACEEMVKCLRAHRLNVDVTWMALAGLVNMTIAGTTRCCPHRLTCWPDEWVGACAEENQVRFGESGGIRMVSNALGAHRTSTRICQVGCRILRNLAASRTLQLRRTAVLGQAARGWLTRLDACLSYVRAVTRCAFSCES